MIYFCDYSKPALQSMEKLGVTNDDVQLIFNQGMSDGLNRRFIDKDGYRTGILFHYDGYTLKYVIETVFKRPLRSKYSENVLAKNRGK